MAWAQQNATVKTAYDASSMLAIETLSDPQLFTKHLKQALVFMQNTGKINFYFSAVFC